MAGSAAAGRRRGGAVGKRPQQVYDIRTGPAAQPDPIGLAGGLNLYAYANGDPITYHDPFGLWGWPVIARATSWIASNARAIGAVVGIGARGMSTLREGRRIIESPQMQTLRDAAAQGRQAAVEIGGKMISYEPDLPASGMTWAGRGFHLGKAAFSSSGELTRTVLHELHRLGTSASIGREAGQQAAAAETQAAARFADQAYRVGQRLQWWK